MSWIVYLLLFVSGIFVVLGDYFAKLWSVKQNLWIFIFSMIAYTLSSLLFIPVLLRGDLIITALIWSLVNIIGFTFVGLYIFKEELSVMQMIGVALGIIAMILLTWTGWK